MERYVIPQRFQEPLAFIGSVVFLGVFIILVFCFALVRVVHAQEITIVKILWVGYHNKTGYVDIKPMVQYTPFMDEEKGV